MAFIVSFFFTRNGEVNEKRKKKKGGHCDAYSVPDISPRVLYSASADNKQTCQVFGSR